MWDRTKENEVEKAKKRFTEHLEKGGVAFITTADKSKMQVFNFDPTFEKIILAILVEGG